MPEQNSNDVDLGIVGTGCATGCGGSCLGAVLLLLLVGAMGGMTGLKTGIPQFIGFLGGLLTYLVTGYMVGRGARTKGKPVHLHVFVVGGLFMLLTTLNFVNPQLARIQDENLKSMAIFWNLMSWVLTIPTMLLGASWSQEDQGGDNS